MLIIEALERMMAEFPAELHAPMLHFAQVVEERFVVSHQDFTELKDAVKDLAVTQARTERRFEEFAIAQKDLAAAQARTEQRVEELAVAQARTEQSLNEFIVRTGERFDQLTAGLQCLERTLDRRFAEIGARWGLQSESAFRQTIRWLVRDQPGVTVTQGAYGGRQVDVVIRNGAHILLEITAQLHKKDIAKLLRSAADYREREGVDPCLMVATSYISPRLMAFIHTLDRPIEIFSYDDDDDGENGGDGGATD
jgi:hypothetical protein